MYIVVETWTPKQSWLDLEEEGKRAFFDGIRDAMRQMSGAGIETLGWGRVDSTADRSTSYDWFAIWQAPTAELAAMFLDGVARSGWYDLFEQTNVVGELGSVDRAVDGHLEMARS